MKKIKKITPYIINILLVLSIFIITLIITKTSPFGPDTLGKSDAIVQFKPMLYDFIMGLKTNTLELFSFNNGLGNPIIFNFLYYLSSPLNIIAILFNSPDSMYLSTIIIKLIFATITVTLYIKKKTNNNTLSTIAALSYVFSSWFLAYYYYLPWLDIFLIFPLFQYGLEKLLTEKKCTIYILSLAYAIISNFYLTFPMCIYTIIYFIIYKLIYCKDTKKEKINSFNRITIATLVTFLLTFFYLYALLVSYTKMGISFDNNVSGQYIIKFQDLLKSFLYGNINFVVDIDTYTFPNIAINTFLFFNFIYYFFNNNISKKSKIYTLIGIIIFISTIYIKTFDFMLNFFHNIRGLTFRYSFIPIFLSIIIAITNITKTDKYDLKNSLLIIIAMFIPLLLNIQNIEQNILIFNIVSILSTIVLIIFYKNTNIFNYLIIIVICIQSLTACYFHINTDTNKTTELAKANYNKETTKYRINSLEQENEFSNKNLYYNANATYLLTSMTYNNVIYTASSLGCSNIYNTSLSCYKNNNITAMFFNEKNDYYLEKIFSVNKNILNISLDNLNIKNSQEALIEATTGIKNIHNQEKIKGTIKDQKSYFETIHNFYLIDVETETLTENHVQTFKSFYYNTDKIKEVNIYTINEEKIKEAYDILNKNQIEYTYYSDSHIEGVINVEHNQLIYTSIPYDTSWEIKIDGKTVKPILLLDSLIGIETTPGTHTITMKYKSNYLLPIIISILTFISLIIYTYFNKKKNES